MKIFGNTADPRFANPAFKLVFIYLEQEVPRLN